MNYLEWTANLGVVPLFLFAAFLLAPIALFFALRRFSVTAVLEAIDISLISFNYLNLTKFKNLTITLLFVKIFLSDCSAASVKKINSDIILAKGEQKEINFEGFKNFSVGNREILSYKLLSKPQKLLIKGKQIGFSDLIIWTSKGKQVHNVYVLSKQKFLKTYQLAETLKNLNLSIDIKGPVMTATGEVSEFSDYLYLQKIKTQFKEQVFFKITIKSDLRNHIVGQVYKRLFNNGFSHISCQAEWLDILCFYEGPGNRTLLKQIEHFYQISFIEEESTFRKKNFLLKLKLVQLERIDGQEIHIGLDKLQTKVSEIFKFGVKKLVDDNLIFLGNSKLELSSLAEPEIVINLDSPQLIEIGSQIPYQNISNQGQQIVAPIDWKFAGLKIQTKISESFGRLKLNFSTEFSRPVGEAINGSKEKSSIILTPGESVKIFQIGFQTTGKGRQGIPFLTEIPILKHLFQSRSDQNTYKQIYGYVQLEEI
jgi:hypothetical protein